jgi:hypothetical protein
MVKAGLFWRSSLTSLHVSPLRPRAGLVQELDKSQMGRIRRIPNDVFNEVIQEVFFDLICYLCEWQEVASKLTALTFY